MLSSLLERIDSTVQDVLSPNTFTTQQNAGTAPMEEGDDRRISVTLQYGSNKQLSVVERAEDEVVLDQLRQRARQLVQRSSSSSTSSLLGEMHLFKHDYHSTHMLIPLTGAQQLDNGSIVEVIIVDRNEKPTRPHVLAVNTYMTPTFCDYCGEILVGLIKQGLQCQRCKCNFHKKCSFAPRNNCSAKQSTTNASLHPMPMTQAYGIEDSSSQSSSSSLFELPHTLAVHNYKTLTVCKVCDKMLFGLMKQGLRCRDCKVNVHKKCSHLLPANCQIPENSITPSFDQMSVDEPLPLQDHPEPATPTHDEDNMIPLSRLPGQASQRGGTQKQQMEGWVIHFNFQEPSHRRRHYWVLHNNRIFMYNEYNDGVNPHRCFRQLPLAEIVAISPYEGAPVDPRFPPHCFEIRTTSNAVICVGENLDVYSGPPSKLPRSQTGRPVPSTTLWLQALTQALQPPAGRLDPPNAEPALQFTEIYQVLSDKTLGSGQFGTVYGGVHRQSGREVAVKVISKERFSKRSATENTLRSEVAILQAISHQGIVRLESMFETRDKIFVVMEQMHGDMLEMILSQAAGRLDERSTKFLIVQILSALRYLHNKGIAHCDLKPENVLLSDLTQPFPQTKLCDFGYARFIGESQFRKTIVGTPAYLPPEVLQKRGYNKSLDMWSVGVIIYVTLSGTFPFNDGEEVSEQIQNAAFMFPADPWKDIGRHAVDLIQKLLRVQIDERLMIEECCTHEWLQGAQLFMDLRQLELRLGGQRYLTNEGDDALYEQFLQQQGLAPAQGIPSLI